MVPSHRRRPGADGAVEGPSVTAFVDTREAATKALPPRQSVRRGWR